MVGHYDKLDAEGISGVEEHSAFQDITSQTINVELAGLGNSPLIKVVGDI